MPIDRSQTDFPQGDGDPKCPKCRGRGVVDTVTKFGMDATIPCDCTFERDLRDHIEAAWKGMTQVPMPEETPLQGFFGKNLWLTAPKVALMPHLHRVGRLLGLGVRWKVLTDIDLMDSWLPKKRDILDPDVALTRHVPTDRYTVLTDLVEPPDLLVLRLGIKAARNVAMPEVLLEALNHRTHWGKPTWIVDSAAYPLADGHISYDNRVGEFLEDWPKLTLTEIGTVGATTPPSGGLRVMPLGGTPAPYQPPAPRPALVVPVSSTKPDMLDRMTLTKEDKDRNARFKKNKRPGGYE